MSRDACIRAGGALATAIALLFLLVTACSERRPSLATQLLIADGQISEGCYRCLDEAVVRYFGLPPTRGHVARANDTKLFRALILLALREKELGLDPAQRLKQAGLLVPQTTTPAAAREQLKWAELVPGNPSALPRDVAEAQRARLLPLHVELMQRLERAAAMTDPLDVYLNVSLVCSSAFLPKMPAPEVVAAPAATQPIVQWRLAICGRTHEDALRAFAKAHPRYDEADYWIGRYRASSGSGSATSISLFSDPAARREARERMQAALKAIPASLAIAYDLAGVTRVTSPRDALPLYERVTRAQPRHHEAWLGQGICLTYLERPREAIDALTKLIDLGHGVVVGDAYYWRAWNRYGLGELDAAWADTEAARKTIYNSDLLTLAGRIAFDQKALDTAQPLLEKGLELSETNCVAAWYLGLVHSTQERWILGGDTFITAEACYRADIDRIRREQQVAAATEVEEAVRAERQAAADASVRVAERQAALSAYNAAFNLVRGGEPARSRPLLDRAAQHPEVSDRARELRAFVDR
jgi:tetratricopeptide (TPR) repeat protein